MKPINLQNPEKKIDEEYQAHSIKNTVQVALHRTSGVYLLDNIARVCYYELSQLRIWN